MIWDWQFLFEDPGGYYPSYLRWMMSAWAWTLAVASTSLVVGLVFGAVVGTLSTVPGHPILKGVCAAWVNLFRGIPLLVQIFLWYHVVPAMFPALQGLSSFILVAFALGLFTSARISEQFKSGILSLPRGQLQASLAMGFTMWQSYRYVILPEAVRIVVPPITSEAMNVVKNSSVAFAVSIPELTMYAMQVQEETSRGIEVYLAVTVLYALSAFAINRLMRFIDYRLQLPRSSEPTKGGK